MAKKQEVDLLEDLTPAQREAVMHMEGPLLVLAAAGSGKTRVITRRVAYLLQQGVHPGNILAITFTNKAAGEMRQRIEALVPGCRVLISTFHSLGARLLRQYGERLELDRNFTIYDQTDRAKLIKMAFEDAGVNNVRFTPESIGSAISKAKNQLLSPDRYAERAGDFYTQVVAEVYPVYEKMLRASNALDFDDLLYWPALALKHDRELREELDARFRYLMIDEYQDTNHAQYSLARSLSVDYPNICVVGDPDQCLPPGSLIATRDGRKSIESLKEGDLVLSGTGNGRTHLMPIEKVMVNHHKGRLVKVTLEGGKVVRATPNHICFAKLTLDRDRHYVYLMWKKGVGFRMGTTRGVRKSKSGDLQSGLQVRMNQEVADAIWIIHSGESSAEARYYEQFYSVTYGIPTMVFFVRGRQMGITQELIDRLYNEVDTGAGAARLMADLGLDRRYPHHRPGGVTRGAWARRHVLFTMFGDARSNIACPWSYHRIQLVTTGEELREAAATRFRVRDGVRGTWRVETSRKHYADGLLLAEEIGKFHDSDIITRVKLTSERAFPCMPAGHLHPGMLVPVLENGKVIERLVKKVEWEQYEGPVYDLSVPHTRNFIANGMVVHNSIYAFRGADIRNILDFERDFPDARVLPLTLNYRSTKSILHAADSLIQHNKKRKHKDLLTDNPQGLPVAVRTFSTGNDEAEEIARHIRKSVAAGERRYRDHAIFVRLNALSRAFETAFVRERVPFQIVKGLAFFDRKENRDVVAYLRLIVNPRDDISFLRIINEPARGIGKVSLEHLKAYAERRELSLVEAAWEVDRITEIKGKASKGIRDFSQILRELMDIKDAQPDELIRQTLDKTGYRKMLRDSRDPDDQERLANIEELITAASQFTKEDSTKSIGDFLENITLASDIDGWNDQQDTVSIMTMHAAKGLEFPVVFIVAMEQGILPHERSLNKANEIEEERRLAFVGMTRAKQELHISRAHLREFRGQTLYAVPSMFLSEIPTETIEARDDSDGGNVPAFDHWRTGGQAASDGWTDAGIRPIPLPVPPRPADKEGDLYKVGMNVRHEKYGEGKVVDLTGSGALRNVKIRFRTAGEKTFRLNKVKLEVL